MHLNKLLCTLFVCAQAAWALPGTWNMSSNQILEDYQKNAKPFAPNDPFMASAWGSLQAHKAQGLAATPAAVFHHSVPSQHFEKGHFDILLHAACDVPMGCTAPGMGRAGIKRAPLIVFSPGIFNEPTDTQSLRGLELYSNRGFHVAVVPNSFSTSYISFKPKSLPGDLVAEARVLLDVVREAQLSLGAENIESVNLVGDSYGAFLVVVAAALDAESAQPLISGSVTSFSAPVIFSKSVRNLDKAYTNIEGEEFTFYKKIGDLLTAQIVRNNLRQYCSDASVLGTAAFEYVVKSAASDLSESSKVCAQYLVAGPGFQQWLVVAGKALRDNGLVKEIPEHPFNEQFLFADYLSVYAPANEHLYGGQMGQGKLDYWLRRAFAKGFDRIRVLSTRDDFLNDPQDWTSSAKLLGDHRFVMLPNGGHLGEMALAWMEPFLDQNFAPRVWGIAPSQMRFQ